MVHVLPQRTLPWTLTYCVLVPLGLWLTIRPLVEPIPSLPGLHASLGFSIFAFLATAHLVPALGQRFVQANLKGRDLLKTYDTPM